jgi:hypothetical protein
LADCVLKFNSVARENAESAYINAEGKSFALIYSLLIRSRQLIFEVSSLVLSKTLFKESIFARFCPWQGRIKTTNEKARIAPTIRLPVIAAWKFTSIQNIFISLKICVD